MLIFSGAFNDDFIDEALQDLNADQTFGLDALLGYQRLGKPEACIAVLCGDGIPQLVDAEQVDFLADQFGIERLQICRAEGGVAGDRQFFEREPNLAGLFRRYLFLDRENQWLER